MVLGGYQTHFELRTQISRIVGIRGENEWET